MDIWVIVLGCLLALACFNWYKAEKDIDERRYASAFTQGQLCYLRGQKKPGIAIMDEGWQWEKDRLKRRAHFKETMEIEDKLMKWPSS